MCFGEKKNYISLSISLSLSVPLSFSLNLSIGPIFFYPLLPLLPPLPIHFPLCRSKRIIMMSTLATIFTFHNCQHTLTHKTHTHINTHTKHPSAHTHTYTHTHTHTHTHTQYTQQPHAFSNICLSKVHSDQMR